jgi:galactitol-specific phosphotransferase system IIB component
LQLAGMQAKEQSTSDIFMHANHIKSVYIKGDSVIYNGDHINKLLREMSLDSNLVELVQDSLKGEMKGDTLIIMHSREANSATISIKNLHIQQF